jgi:N-acetyl-1-D-myo-inositol-2-amino-2-deoxy-alpha-D-glucopyranoside deacetylase/mycothiol S-conjugate amidase
VAARIVQHIRRLRPQVVITHDPIGGYKHPDHIAVHQATLMAFHAAADPDFQLGDLAPYQPQKLYYSTFSKRLIRLLVRVLPWMGVDVRRWGRNKDIDLLDLAEEEPFPIHAEIDYREQADAKDRASACHASQLEGGPPRRGLISWLFRLALGSKDQFMRAYPKAGPEVHEDDLFQGVRV